MNNAKGTVFKFGDNVDTDVIIPARYPYIRQDRVRR
jgi:3-isopropylmalate/(R)-2-methylmalate dehydratase small subunit